MILARTHLRLVAPTIPDSELEISQPKSYGGSEQLCRIVGSWRTFLPFPGRCLKAQHPDGISFRTTSTSPARFRRLKSSDFSVDSNSKRRFKSIARAHHSYRTSSRNDTTEVQTYSWRVPIQARQAVQDPEKFSGLVQMSARSLASAIKPSSEPCLLRRSGPFSVKSRAPHAADDTVYSIRYQYRRVSGQSRRWQRSQWLQFFVAGALMIALPRRLRFDSMRVLARFFRSIFNRTPCPTRTVRWQ